MNVSEIKLSHEFSSFGENKHQHSSEDSMIYYDLSGEEIKFARQMKTPVASRSAIRAAHMRHVRSLAAGYPMLANNQAVYTHLRQTIAIELSSDRAPISPRGTSGLRRVAYEERGRKLRPCDRPSVAGKS
ncbi:hypothetical protein [Rhizobium esperanzae]|uniref:Uncharacterized protein n=1 Tax=Rhizobium esperanzae TaxID=1967781 RepID=A0A7W6R0E2_9HYPH|nr:hypothetical protein [Rhizobium esperanzae]MBB4234468.1 hypothetical protein [Rhizobium esperanzae]